jgi:hypothetical protein
LNRLLKLLHAPAGTANATTSSSRTKAAPQLDAADLDVAGDVLRHCINAKSPARTPTSRPIYLKNNG